MANPISKTYVAIANEGLALFDTIHINEQRWIVPEWIDGYPTKGFSRPARMIRIDLLAQGRFRGIPVLHTPIPKAVLDGESIPPYEVVLLPNQFVEFGDPGLPV